ncbi:hypothetical protein [uncultured Chryseobacterium sp.]|uniref:hypothetical protein n=1 Tax=uncultured Chryseobacterium sp. TaxID=259322 RepID=UPI00258424AF|nr:hypothetical protein [uncultured Chryseobacterium sp.]
MKLRGTIREETHPSKNTMIVEFEGDKKKQHFEVKCSFNPYNLRLRKWDIVDMWIKWESEVFEDPKTGEKSYFTHLTCDRAIEFVTNYGKR